MKPLLLTVLMFISSIASAQFTNFSNYSVPVYKGRPATLKLKSNPIVRQFKTVISQTYNSGKTGANFAGHYCFVYWGCGSPCKSSAIVDLKTGIVYDGVTAAFDFKFIKNSRLLMADPDVTEGPPYKTEYWLWNDDKKHFERSNAKQ